MHVSWISADLGSTCGCVRHARENKNKNKKNKNKKKRGGYFSETAQKIDFLREMLQEIVKKLRPEKSDFEHPRRGCRNDKPPKKKHGSLECVVFLGGRVPFPDVIIPGELRGSAL